MQAITSRATTNMARSRPRGREPSSTASGNSSQAVSGSRRLVLMMAMTIIAAMSASEYSKKRRAMGGADFSASTRMAAMHTHAGMLKVQYQGATDSLTNAL